MEALSAEERAKKMMEGVPDLPPLLAAILAETRAKQQRAKERVEQGLPAEDPEEEAQAKAAKRAKVGGPLLLEGPGAHLMVATNDAPIPKEVDSEDSDSEEEPEAPPGPPDAAHCKAQGPGFSGAAAGQPVKLTIMARDAAGKRVREGGAHILVMVEPVGAAPAADGGEAEAIEAEVEDHSNGTYTAIYSVPSKGNYQLHIEVNSEPMGGSPFPIFFSAPAPAPPAPTAQDASAEAMHLASLAPGSLPLMTADAIKQQQQAVAGGVSAAMAGIEAAAAVAAALGTQMFKIGLRFASALKEETLARMVVVGGVPADAKKDELKELFGQAGKLDDVILAGSDTGFAFLEFRKPEGAVAAAALNGIVVLNQSVLRVELATEAKKARDAAAAAAAQPYLAMQAMQRQQFALLQQQQHALAEQVVAMRVQQRVGVAPPAPAPKPHDSDSQKSAAIAAAIALSKKLAAAAGGDAAAAAAAAAPVANGSDRKRSRSRSCDRRRRSRSRERRRSRSRDRRSGRRSSKDRKERRRSRSRSRERRHHKHRHHHRKDRRRSRSRDRKGGEDKEGSAEKMDVDGAPQGGGKPPAVAAAATDELEALLEELGE
ncbi:RNA recognition motif-containing isoform 1 isoform A [Micractinium conductrix]|uniref:RNA recognition motif-containing isoform 1 isoform A n=1 Tax=Micractinium conductrix TaxID=554055 RepID=A0A2P6VGD9_9CHLO|nr:RNA recognition motif-containing isoform 1 isoform A [Micractinium conductrix]|eukprot:PSC73143.1 RNA recognition motif-containing isoform 1 isoform A [Micractinium conductrix]